MEITTLAAVFLVGMAVLAPAHSADKDSCAAGVCVKVLGQSGKITMAVVSSAGDIASDADRVTISMSEIKEVDAQGNEVGKTGTPKHSFNTFASQTFTFTDVQSGTLQNVKADYFSFESTLTGLTSKVKFTMYIFKEDGNITYGEEIQMVKKGAVKFNIDLSSWQFCSPCTMGQADENGAFVDFSLEIKGKGTASGTTSSGFNLGGDVVLKLANRVRIDDVWQDMVAGFPKYESQGGKQMYTFRFNKFTQTAFYDPTIYLEGEANGAETVVTSLLLTIGALLLAKLF